MNGPDPKLNWPICQAGVELISHYESCVYNSDGLIRSYLCPAGVWTGPWGVTSGIRAGMTWTQAEGDQLFCTELTNFTARVKELVKTDETDQEELAALVSLAYNIGIENFEHSTVLRQHNAGNRQAAARAFSLWNKAHVHGQLIELAGLTARRAAESALYLESSMNASAVGMPQEVEPETKIAASPIVQGGAALTGTGLLTAASDYGGQLKTLADNFGIQPLYVLIGAMVIIGGYIIWQRLNQRKEGWV